MYYIRANFERDFIVGFNLFKNLPNRFDFWVKLHFIDFLK